MRAFLLLLPCALCAGPQHGVPSQEEALVDFENSVEHEVEVKDALFTAKELFRTTGPATSGCSQCTSQDMDYCLSKDLLHDHCCCDHNLPERYPYIPHACYKQDVPLCQPTAGDCEEFFRLDVCCCQPYLRPQWQYHSWTSSSAMLRSTITLTIVAIHVLAKAR